MPSKNHPDAFDGIFWLIMGVIFVVISVVLVAVEIPVYVEPEVKSVYTTEELKAKVSDYMDVELSGNWSSITAEDALALHYWRKAAVIIDDLFFHQVLDENPRIRQEIEEQVARYQSHVENSDTDHDELEHWQTTLEYFNINAGPYETLNKYNPIVKPTSRLSFPDTQPLGATYYPRDITEADWNEFVASINQTTTEGRELYDCAQNTFSVMYREEGAKKMDLKCMYYSEAYEPWIQEISYWMTKGANHTTQQDLKDFVLARVDAFASNEYGYSDELWLTVANTTTIEVTVGPYETYMDQLAGIRAAWEIYIGINRLEQTEAVSIYSTILQDLEDMLPDVCEDYTARELGITGSTVKVVDLVFSAGEATQSSQTLAYNLPNNETPNKMASKQTMLYNVQQAKFDYLVVPIAKQTLADPLGRPIEEIVSFDANFQHTVSHEMAHAIGPVATLAGQPINVALGSSYSAIEEAKADIGAIWSVQYLSVEQDVFALPCTTAHTPDNIHNYGECGEFREKYYASFVAQMFRTMRFGFDEAHGRGCLCYFNYLLEAGAVVAVDNPTDGQQYFWYDADAMATAIPDLLEELIQLELDGSGQQAADWMTNWARELEVIVQAVNRINEKDIPVDIRPVYDDF